MLFFVHIGYGSELVRIAHVYNSSHPATTIPIASEDDDRISLPYISKAEQLHLAAHIFSEQHPLKQYIDEDTYNNLEIYSGACLLDHINRTRTALGLIGLADMLATPTTSSAELTRRQKLITTIAQNQDVLETICQTVQQFKKGETISLHLFGRNNKREHFLEYYYFKNLPEEYNMSAAFLGTSMRVPDVMRILSIPFTLYYLKTSYEKNTPIYGDMNYPLADRMIAIGDITNAALATPYMFYDSWYWYKEVIKDIEYIHRYVSLFAQQLECARHLHTKILKHPELLPLFPETGDLIAFFQSPDSSLHGLLYMLQSDTFQEPFSYMHSSLGVILATYALLIKHAKHFVPVLVSIGKIDAITSIAALKNEYSHKQTPLCMASFVEQEAPMLSFTNVWNPLVPQENPVRNSISIGSPRTIIITGQNSGGKSTVAKSILIGALMAQTCGIVPADSCIITPFAYIGTSINIADNIKEKQSTFVAEASRAQKLMEKLKHIQNTGKGLVIIDEAFKGTGNESADLAYWYAQQLGALQNSISIHITHHAKLVSLAEKWPEMFANYRVPVIKDAQGKLIRTYTLEPGYTLDSIASDILVEMGLIQKKDLR